MAGTQAPRREEHGIALVVVLLILAASTIVGLGIMASAISDLKVTANQACYNRIANAAEVGIEEGRLDVSSLSGQGIRRNSNNSVYQNNPRTFYNVKNCGSLDQAPQATDAAAECSLANSFQPDGFLVPVTGKGGATAYAYEFRRLPQETRRALRAGEGAGNVNQHEYVIHSMGAGCDVETVHLTARVARGERRFGESTAGSGSGYVGQSAGATGGTPE